jgi:hypothetical protein
MVDFQLDAAAALRGDRFYNFALNPVCIPSA